jgi:hypothetical protein
VRQIDVRHEGCVDLGAAGNEDIVTRCLLDHQGRFIQRRCDERRCRLKRPVTREDKGRSVR